MRQWAVAFWLVLAIGAIGGAGFAYASTVTPSGLVTGRVLVCNIPGRCLTRVFRVVAVNSAGALVAHTETVGKANVHHLHLAAGRYSLTAVSKGLRCKG